MALQWISTKNSIGMNSGLASSMFFLVHEGLSCLEFHDEVSRYTHKIKCSARLFSLFLATLSRTSLLSPKYCLQQVHSSLKYVVVCWYIVEGLWWCRYKVKTHTIFANTILTILLSMSIVYNLQLSNNIT